MKKLTSKEFVYNDNEVCINPNEILMMEKPKDWSQPFFLIATSIYNGRWIFGYTVHLNNLGLGEPCMYRIDKCTFNTEIGAINEAIDEIRVFALKLSFLCIPIYKKLYFAAKVQNIFLIGKNILLLVVYACFSFFYFNFAVVKDIALSIALFCMRKVPLNKKLLKHLKYYE